MENGYPTPRPLFDNLKHLDANPEQIFHHLQTLQIPAAVDEFKLSLAFLKTYAKSPDTFTAYRREIERLLHWCWLICKKSLREMTAPEIQRYLSFVNTPPNAWVATKNVDRFKDANGIRVPNPEWRPFVLRTHKSQRLQGRSALQLNHQLGKKSIEAIYATLGSFFSYLHHENYLAYNPIHILRETKDQTKQSKQIPRQLNNKQWQAVLTAAQALATNEPHHQRTYFLIALFYFLGLRVSDLANNKYFALMQNFIFDSGVWYYNSLGTMEKRRMLVVPETLIDILSDYRLSLGLSLLPTAGETTPLLAKLKGKKGLGPRQIRNLVQVVFDLAIKTLRQDDQHILADELSTATVHCLQRREQQVNQTVPVNAKPT